MICVESLHPYKAHISESVHICINIFCFVNLDASILTPQLTIDDLQQTKVTAQPDTIKDVICVAEMWNMAALHSFVCNLSPDLLETSQEAAEGCGGFEEEAC